MKTNTQRIKPLSPGKSERIFTPLTAKNVALLKKYRKLKLAVEAAEDAVDEIKEDVCELLKILPENQAVVEGDKMSLAEANTYDYPPEIKQAQAALDSLRKDARTDGKATVTKQSFRVVFTKSKASVIV
jgi:hypothetical protein